LETLENPNCTPYRVLEQRLEMGSMSKSVKFLGRRIPVPRNMLLRMGFGILCVFGGFLGFLPILGFWMLPLGLLILSVDLPPVRRFRRRAEVKVGQVIRQRFPWLARKFGWTTST
jgi:hypothetical protein